MNRKNVILAFLMSPEVDLSVQVCSMNNKRGRNKWTECYGTERQ